MRVIEKFFENRKEWKKISFGDLKTGDVFRIFDNGDRYVNAVDGNNIWIATSDAYKDNDVFKIDTLY